MKVSLAVLLFLASSTMQGSEAKKLHRGAMAGDMDVGDLYTYTEKDNIEREIAEAKEQQAQKEHLDKLEAQKKLQAEMKRKQEEHDRKVQSVKAQLEDEANRKDALTLSMGGKNVTIVGLAENDPEFVQAELEGEAQYVQLLSEPKAKTASNINASEVFSDDASHSKEEVETAKKVAALNVENNKRLHWATDRLAALNSFQDQKEKEMDETEKQLIAQQKAEKALQEHRQMKQKQAEEQKKTAEKEKQVQEKMEKIAAEVTRPYVHVDGLLHNKDGSKAFPKDFGVVGGANLYAQHHAAF